VSEGVAEAAHSVNEAQGRGGPAIHFPGPSSIARALSAIFRGV